MKTLSMCGLAATIIILGVLIYTLWSAMLYLAWIIAGCGVIGLAIGLLRLAWPLVESTVKTKIAAKEASNKEFAALVNLSLQERVLSYAERHGLQVELAANGTIAATYPTTRATVPPALPKQEFVQPQETAPLPMNVRYEDIAHRIPRGHGLLGVAADRVETAEFHDFMTMLISGGSNSGKSNTVGLKLHEAIQNGRDIRLLVIDWHWRKPDSLYNKIKAYEPRFLMPLVKDEESTLPVLEWFFNEFKRRLRDGLTEQDYDILLVVDEVPGMMDAEDERIPKMLKLIARKCGREARGFGMYGWFIAQQMIGLAWLRNVVHTVIGHKATRINEAEIVCNDHRDIARDMENWPAGRVIVYGQNFQGVKVLQMPIFVPQQEERTTGTLAHPMAVPDAFRNAFTEATEPLETIAPTVPPALENLASEREKIPAQEREQIINLAKQGVARRDMCRMLGRGNGYYEIVKTVLNEEGL